MSDEKDKYAHVRNLPLLGILTTLGFTEWKTRKNGREWYGRCPVHKAVKNSSSFSFDAEGKWHCFSCSEKGKGAIDLVMKVEGINFRAAVERLEALAPSIPSQLTAVNQASDEAVNKMENEPFKGSYEKFAVPSPWLETRGFSADILKRFEVFQYDNPKRKSQYSGSVMLKIRRYSDGECVGYLSRNIGEITPEKPKYRFPAGFQKGLELFGAFQLKNEAPIRRVFVLESPFAVMKFAQCGVPAVALFGWTATPEQASILAQLAKGCLFVPDRNKWQEAGATAGLLARHLWTKMPSLPDGISDPEELDGDSIRSLT